MKRKRPMGRTELPLAARRRAPLRAAAPVLLLLAAVAVVVGCGGSEERPEIDRSRLQPAEPLDPAAGGGADPAGREEGSAAGREGPRDPDEIARELFMWPGDAGPPRDVVADSRACQEQLENEPRMQNARPLARFNYARRCMLEKGWVIDPEAGQ